MQNETKFVGQYDEEIKNFKNEINDMKIEI